MHYEVEQELNKMMYHVSNHMLLGKVKKKCRWNSIFYFFFLKGGSWANKKQIQINVLHE